MHAWDFQNRISHRIDSSALIAQIITASANTDPFIKEIMIAICETLKKDLHSHFIPDGKVYKYKSITYNQEIIGIKASRDVKAEGPLYVVIHRENDHHKSTGNMASHTQNFTVEAEQSNNICFFPASERSFLGIQLLCNNIRMKF